jgi:hypothetical protein
MDFNPGDKSNAIYLRAYRSLFDNIGIHHGNNGNQISPAQFIGGCFLLAWDFSPDQCLSFHSHLPETGSIDLNFQWATAIGNNGLDILVFGAFDDAFTMDKFNSISTRGYETPVKK